jgi:hypothetical protein
MRQKVVMVRLPPNRVLQERIAHLLTRPVGRPPKRPRVFHASFSYQAQSWRRVVAKVEWLQGELYPRVGFVVTNLKRPAERVVRFYNGRGTAEQWIREGKAALRWTRIPCRAFRANAAPPAVRACLQPRQPPALACLAGPGAQWSLTTVREKLVKIGARIVRHGRYVVFQLAEVAVPRTFFAEILRRIERLRLRPSPLPA